MYSVFRYIFFALVCLGGVFYSRKKKFRHSATVALLLSCVLLCGLFNMWPVENAFFSFQSPNDVFSYMHREGPSLLIEGRKSALVVAKDETESIIYEIVPKTKSGWKLPTITSSKEIVRRFYGATHVQIYSCSNEDYYVFVIANDINTIRDNKGSKFQCEKRMVGGRSITSGYAYVDDLTEYCLMLDGNEVKIL